MKTLTILAALVFLASCASTAGAKSDATSGPMNDPPADKKQGSLPDGPDTVISQAEVPKDYAAPEDNEGSSSVSRAQVEQFMDNGPAFVFTVVTVDPARNESGMFVGYQIVEVTSEARKVMMPQLRVGDVVTHVNGVKLEKPDDLIEAWKALKRIDVAVVDFKRQGESMQATWSIE